MIDLKPVFKKEQDMLEGFGLSHYPDKSLFIDRMKVLFFDKDNKKNIVAKLKVTINGKFALEDLPKNTDKLISCKDYYSYIDLDSKISSLKDKILSELHPYLKEHKLILMNSTGKDSVLAKYVCDKLELKYEEVFVNTSLDVHHTYKIAKQNNMRIVNPKVGFYTWIDTNIIPSRLVRKCCDIFKEGEVAEQFDPSSKIVMITGMRNDESLNRRDYPYVMENSKWDTQRKSNWKLFNIIREFTEDEVWFAMLNDLVEVNPLYEYGYKRVGCAVACPYQSDYTEFLDSIVLPKYKDNWDKKKKNFFIKNKLWTVLNCTLEEYLFSGWKLGTKYRDTPTQEVIDEFISYTGLNDHKKYFNNTCVNGCKSRYGNPVKLKTEHVSLNLKLLGRYLGNGDMLCEKCLMDFFNLTKKDLKQQVANFKKEGCVLFK